MGEASNRSKLRQKDERINMRAFCVDIIMRKISKQVFFKEENLNLLVTFVIFEILLEGITLQNMKIICRKYSVKYKSNFRNGGNVKNLIKRLRQAFS